jgi:hypothetical protein
MLFGGPHSSMPSFLAFGIKAGDTVYPMQFRAGSLFLLTQFKVRAVLPIKDFVESRDPAFIELGEPKFQFGLPVEHPQAYLATTCTSDVALGVGTPWSSNVQVPDEWLPQLRYHPRTGERDFGRIVKQKLASISSIQGQYRISPATAELFASWFSA